jgi:hypothetical protein
MPPFISFFAHATFYLLIGCILVFSSVFMLFCYLNYIKTKLLCCSSHFASDGSHQAHRPKEHSWIAPSDPAPPEASAGRGTRFARGASASSPGGGTRLARGAHGAPGGGPSQVRGGAYGAARGSPRHCCRGHLYGGSGASPAASG